MLGDCFLMGVIIGLDDEVPGLLVLIWGAVLIVTAVDLVGLPALVTFLEAIGLMRVDLDTAVLEETRDLVGAEAVLSGILMVF